MQAETLFLKKFKQWTYKNITFKSNRYYSTYDFCINAFLQVFCSAPQKKLVQMQQKTKCLVLLCHAVYKKNYARCIVYTNCMWAPMCTQLGVINCTILHQINTKNTFGQRAHKKMNDLYIRTAHQYFT